MKKKFLFLYLKTGGGHLANAKALQSYFSRNHGSSVEVVLGDGLEESNRIVKKIIEDGYAQVQSNGQSFYEFLYACNKLFIVAKTNQVLMSEWTKDSVKELIETEHPTEIVVFHFFLVRAVREALKELNIKIPVTTIVTDPFTAPRLWFLEKDMHYIVYSEQAKTVAKGLGIEDKNLQYFPPMLNQQFDIIPSKEEVIEWKKKHKLSLDKKIILILGGGDGMPQGKKIFQELVKLNDVQVVMVCGKNKSLYKNMMTCMQKHLHLYPKVYGFVDFVYELISMADVVITKGGPASIMEILRMGKIPVITTYLREQEKGNVDFVVNNQVGLYEKDIDLMAEKVEHLLQSDLTQYQENIKKLDIKNGVKDIAEYLLQRS